MIIAPIGANRQALLAERLRCNSSPEGLCTAVLRLPLLKRTP